MKVLSLVMIAVGVLSLGFGVFMLNEWRNSYTDSMCSSVGVRPQDLARRMELCEASRSESLRNGMIGGVAGVVLVGAAIAVRRSGAQRTTAIAAA